VKFGSALFIVTAEHCFSNLGINPEQSLYPRPSDPRGFFAFDLKTVAKSPKARDAEHSDQIILRVSVAHHPVEETSKVRALDLAVPSNSSLPTRVKDIVLRGFPWGLEKHRIDYDAGVVRQQAFATNGLVTANQSPFDHCYYIKMMTPIPDGMTPNGMSGTPAYGVMVDGAPVYCGTVICFNTVTREYLIIGPEMLVNILRNLQKTAPSSS
jgi:hypothetical protein